MRGAEIVLRAAAARRASLSENKRGERPGGANWGMHPRDGTLLQREEDVETSAPVPTLPGYYPGYYAAVRDTILRGESGANTDPRCVPLMRKQTAIV